MPSGRETRPKAHSSGCGLGSPAPSAMNNRDRDGQRAIRTVHVGPKSGRVFNGSQNHLRNVVWRPVRCQSLNRAILAGQDRWKQHRQLPLACEAREGRHWLAIATTFARAPLHRSVVLTLPLRPWLERPAATGSASSWHEGKQASTSPNMGVGMLATATPWGLQAVHAI